MKTKLALGAATALCAVLATSGVAGAAKPTSPGAVPFDGALELSKGTAAAAPFHREDVLTFDAWFGKTPQNKTPWVEVRCVPAASDVAVREPGSTDGEVMWFNRDYTPDPYAVRVGDAGGSSLWQSAYKYADVRCRAFLFLYYDVRGYETVALFGSTDEFEVLGAPR